MKKLIETIKRYLPVFVAAIICGVVLLCCWMMGRSFGGSEGKANVVQASAASVDSTAYASANLMPFPYHGTKENSTYTQDGITYTFYADGRFYAKGTNTKTSASVLYLFDGLHTDFIGKTITLSGATFTSNFASLNCQYFNGSTLLYGQTVNYYNVKSTRSDIGTYTRLLVYFAVNGGASIDQEIKPMLNEGSTAYPFIPSLERIYSQGKVEGYEEGNMEGYEEGKTDGLIGANSGFLNGATFSCKYSNSSGLSNYSLSGINSDLVDRGISTTTLYNQLQSNSAVSVYEFQLSFLSPVYGKDLILVAYGNQDTFIDSTTSSPKIFYAETSEGNVYQARFVYEEALGYYGFEINSSGNYDFYVTRLYNWSIGNVSNLSNLRLIAPRTAYSLGYGEGFDEGYEVGKNDNLLYDEGYDKGYKVGLSQGKSSISSDILSNSISSFVFALFDAPVSTFLTAFNLEYDGFNIGDLVAFVLSGVVIFGVLKWVL